MSGCLCLGKLVALSQLKCCNTFNSPCTAVRFRSSHNVATSETAYQARQPVLQKLGERGAGERRELRKRERRPQRGVRLSFALITEPK